MYNNVLFNERCPKNIDIYKLKYEYSLPEFTKLQETLEIFSAYEQARFEDSKVT